MATDEQHLTRPPPEPPPPSTHVLDKLQTPLTQADTVDETHEHPPYPTLSDADAPSRWFQEHHPTLCQLTDWNGILQDMRDLQSPAAPAGSLMTLTRPKSPTSVLDPPTPALLDLDNGLPADTDPFDDLVDFLACNTVVALNDSVRTIGVLGDTARLTRTNSTDTKIPGLMADTGANACVKQSEDGLVNVRDIPPVHLNLALADNSPTMTFTSCTKMGYLPLLRSDGTEHLQPFLIHKFATDAIMSPESILHASTDFHSWRQIGYKSDQPGRLEFRDDKDTVLLTPPLTKRNGLYYHDYNIITTDRDGVHTRRPVHAVHRLSTRASTPNQTTSHTASKTTKPTTPKRNRRRQGTRPVHPSRQIESELWAARLGHCSEWQLEHLPGGVTGTPDRFDLHPFRFVDHREQARIQRKAAGRQATRVTGPGKAFHVDFGFIRASTHNFAQPSPEHDRIVESFDGFTSYLLIVDEASRYVWILLCTSKEPPIEEMSAFLSEFGLKSGGLLRCDRGGELARSADFITTMQRDFGYKAETTGADSPNQNGGAERYNQTLAVTVRSLLYGASLHAKYCSAALIHAAYLHNRRIHRSTG